MPNPSPGTLARYLRLRGFPIDYLNPIATFCCHRSMNQPLWVCEPSVDQVATEQLHVNFYLTMPLLLRYNVLTLNRYVELFVRISIAHPNLKNLDSLFSTPPIIPQIAVNVASDLQISSKGHEHYPSHRDWRTSMTSSGNVHDGLSESIRSVEDKNTSLRGTKMRRQNTNVGKSSWKPSHSSIRCLPLCFFFSTLHVRLKIRKEKSTSTLLSCISVSGSRNWNQWSTSTDASKGISCSVWGVL